MSPSLSSGTSCEHLTIRPAVPSDIERIAALQVAMARETESLELDPATVYRGVAALFDHPERGQYWIAEVDSSADAEPGGKQALAGCLMTMAEWSDWRNGTVLWIHSVYVVPAFRRRGVFRAMYRFLKTMVLEDETLHGLRLFVDRRNHNAQRTYTELGMSDEHYRLFEWMKTS